MLQYINRYYWEDGTNELNTAHRNKMEAHVLKLWRQAHARLGVRSLGSSGYWTS